MQNDVYAIVIPLVVGVMLLFIEYRTGWFAKHITGKQREQSQDGYSKDEAADWAEAIYNVRVRLAKIYGIKPNDIVVLKWKLNFFETSVSVRVRFWKPIGDKSWSETYCTITADKQGRILKQQEG